MTHPRLQVLLVEDEDSMIDRWNEAVDAFNADVEKNGFFIGKLSAKSVQEAQEILATRKLDAVVVDIRLQGEAGVGEDNDDGNKLIRHIGATQPIGIVVYTGQTVQADVSGLPPQAQVLDKGGGTAPVFAWLSSQKDLFLRLRGIRVAVERETAKIFFKSIWPRWERWTKNSDENTLTEALARHVTAHVHDSLLHAAGGAAHAEETYFVPPLKDWLDTGDLLRRDSGLWIVVTPRCDLANAGKVVTVLLAKCEDISERWNKVDGSTKAGEKELKKIAQHEGSPKQHFLPAAIDGAGAQLGPWLVQFHHLEAMEIKAARRDLTPLHIRIASLAPQFVPSLVERFGAYFSRIGTPNLSSE